MDKPNISIRSDQSTSNFPVTVKYLKNIFNKRKCRIISRSIGWSWIARFISSIISFSISLKVLGYPNSEDKSGTVNIHFIYQFFHRDLSDTFSFIRCARPFLSWLFVFLTRRSVFFCIIIPPLCDHLHLFTPISCYLFSEQPCQANKYWSFLIILSTKRQITCSLMVVN